MSLEIALPSHIEQHLQTEWGNELPRRAAEALAIEGYRTGVLSLGEVANYFDCIITLRGTISVSSPNLSATVSSSLSSVSYSS